MNVIYVTWYYPGAIVAEDSSEKTTTRDPHEIKIPNHCYSFRFWEREEEVRGEETLISTTRKNYSKMYHVNGKIFTSEEILERDGDCILYRNIKGHDGCIRERFGNYQHYDEEKDEILERKDIDD